MTRVINDIINSKVIVVKVGTSTITHSNGKPNLETIEKLARVLVDFKNQGRNIVLVSSGAIGIGRSKIGLNRRPETVREKQALASIGQVSLMYIYSKLFGEYNQVVSQVLITKDSIENSKAKQNATNTFNMLFEYGCIPIVNENDTIATEEIEFGDNDTLSAVVAELIGADLLVLLSDIDGLYNKNPKKCEDASLISVVQDLSETIIDGSDDTDNSFGTGGMKTKLTAAGICSRSGIPMIITNGNNPENIRKILKGQRIGTVFVPKAYSIKESSNNL